MKWTLLTIAALLGLAAMILPACGEAQAGSQAKNDITELPSLEGKKVLMVYGGWEGHKPK